MYHPSKIADRIATEGLPFLRESYLERGWKVPADLSVTYRSVAEVEAFDAHLKDEHKYTYTDAGVITGCQNLEPWEIQWQLNERVLVVADAMYGCTRYGYVIDEAGIICRFAARVAQQILFGVIQDLEALDVSIEIMILKARQLGITTLVELLIMLRVVFSYGVNGVIASADRSKSLLMAKKLLFAYDMLPVWMRPMHTARVESEQGAKFEFGSLNSGVIVQHGNQMSGISRGATPTIYHLSECSSFSNAAQQIEAALFKAVHGSPNVFGILESSGEGDQGWWPDTWRSSKDNWPLGTARLFPLFLPWFTGIGMWPDVGWLRKHPVPEAFHARRLSDTREQVAKAELYVSTHALIRKHLCAPHPQAPRGMESWWTDGQMPIEQQWFWEVEHEEAKRKSLEGTFFQEMAGDDMEALQRSSESVFGFETMQSVDAGRAKKVAVYGLSGQSIEDAYEPPPEDIDYSQPRTPVMFRSQLGESYRWELIPLLHDSDRVDAWKKSNPDAFWDYAHGKLFVWHPPLPGFDYSIGIDSSEGKGEDSTVISVCQMAPRAGMPDIQAAEFRSAYVSHVQVYAFAMAIAAWYASAMEASGMTQTQPMVAPEVVAAVGDICLVQMRKMGYRRFPAFVRYDSKKINQSKSNKVGWYTYGWSRPILLGTFIHSIVNGWYELNSPWTIYECEHFESHVTATGKIKQEHEDGEHDDGIFASAISMQVYRGLQSMTERSKKRFMGDAGAASLPPLDLAPTPWGSRAFSSDPKRNQELSLRDLMAEQRNVRDLAPRT